MEDQEIAHEAPPVQGERTEPDPNGPDLQHRIEALTRSIEHLHTDILALGREQAEARAALVLEKQTGRFDDGKCQ